MRQLNDHKGGIDLLEGGGQDSLGIVIEYQRPERELLANKRVAMAKEACGCVDGAVRLGVIGAGQFVAGGIAEQYFTAPLGRRLGVDRNRHAGRLL